MRYIILRERAVPAVIALHTSGGFKTVQHLIKRYVDDGFVVYAPDFFSRYKNHSKDKDGDVWHLP